MGQQITVLVTTSSFNVEGFPSSIGLVKNPYKRRLREEEVKELIATYQPDGIISGVEPLTRDVLESSGKVKVISRCGADLYSIDSQAAKKMGILVYNTSTAPDLPVAELTLAMILCLLRRIKEMDNLVRTSQWQRPITGLLSGKTVGIIGCGIRGTRVASLLEPFGCQMIGYDVNVRRHEYFEMVNFGQLITLSDIISLHAPLTADNYHLLGEVEISKMKDGVIIINTARGGLIDEDALYRALLSGKVSGAGLDVFEDEPYQGPLNNFKGNLILTPHIGSFAGTYRYDMEKEAMQNMIEGLTKQGFEV